MEGQENKSPFKFLDSYAKTDRDIFFGREQETEELYSKVFQSKLLLVYGASGTGKSSVINCGLANKFDDADWLPVHVRRGGNIMRSLYNQLQKVTIMDVKLPHEPDRQFNDLKTLVGSVFLDHFKPIYLIFDQFEELFIFGYEDEWKAFIESVKCLMESDLDVHFIFVIRGEYLEFLSEFEEFIPEFFDNRVRIEKMTRKNALESIKGPAELYSIDLEEGFEDKLLKQISPDKAHVELTFLQVFLDRIYKNAIQKSNVSERILLAKDQIDETGQMGDVLVEFVDEQLFKMEDSRAALAVLKTFVSLQGTKTQMTVDAIAQQTKAIGSAIEVDQVEEIVAEFVNKRILKDIDDNDQYELRHDSLAQKIYEKISHQEREILDVRQFLNYSLNEYNKRGILLNDQDLLYVSPYERQLNLDKDTFEFIDLSKKNSKKRKKAQRRRTFVAVIILALLITSVFGLLYSQQQKTRAENLAKLAQQESEEAQRQKSIAEEQSALALTNEAEAKEQAEIANSEKSKAVIANLEAQKQRVEALNQKQIAEREKKLADQARLQSEQSEKEALASRAIAEEERQKALTLRMLGLSRELAVKSTHMVDPQLKGLLALQAYIFHNRYGGSAFEPDIYAALYNAHESLSTVPNNSIKLHHQPIGQLEACQESVYSVGNDGRFMRTDWTSGEPKVTVLMQEDLAFESLFVTPNESSAYIGTLFGELVLFDLVSNRIGFQKKLHQSEISNVLKFDDRVITAGMDGRVFLLEPTGAVIKEVDLNQPLTTSISNDKDIWVGTKGGSLIQLNGAGEVVNSLIPHGENAITALGWVLAGVQLAIGYDTGEILILNTTSGEPEQILPGHSAAITDIEVSNDKEYLLSGSYDRSVRLWHLISPEEPPIIIQDRKNWISSVSFDSAGQYFYSGEYDGTMKKFELRASGMASTLCQNLERNLTAEEWHKFVGEDIDSEKTCNNE